MHPAVKLLVENWRTLLVVLASIVTAIFSTGIYFAEMQAKIDKYVALVDKHEKLATDHEAMIKSLRETKVSDISLEEYATVTSWVHAENMAECPLGDAVVVHVGVGNKPDVRIKCARLVIGRK